jgi:hypothetical protein
MQSNSELRYSLPEWNEELPKESPFGNSHYQISDERRKFFTNFFLEKCRHAVTIGSCRFSGHQWRLNPRRLPKLNPDLQLTAETPFFRGISAIFVFSAARDWL